MLLTFFGGKIGWRDNCEVSNCGVQADTFCQSSARAGMGVPRIFRSAMNFCGSSRLGIVARSKTPYGTALRLHIESMTGPVLAP